MARKPSSTIWQSWTRRSRIGTPGAGGALVVSSIARSYGDRSPTDRTV